MMKSYFRINLHESYLAELGFEHATSGFEDALQSAL